MGRERVEIDEDRLKASQARDDVDNPPDAGETISDYFAFEEIFARVLATADHELDASSKFLFWSGLAAGFALGLSFLAKVIFTDVSGEETPGLLGLLMYPVGFFIIVIGRYQLFTENTLTPVVLVMTKLASVSNLLRLWSVVLFANMIGAIAVAALIAYADVLDTKALVIALQIGRHAAETPWLTLFSKALIAGWIVASMVWLVHAAMDTISKILIVWFLMYFVGVAGFFHVVTSSVEVFFLSFRSEVAFWPLWHDFVLPIIVGNTIGGILFVAVVNWVQFDETRDDNVFVRYGDRLSWREWAFGRSRKVGDGTPRVE
ncbi:MAG: formate/nitrite transporter family protein [Rhizobiaceae bacterium]|nr:formate/nitrite transporter family protein [Rhizobiaceae bacterium]